MQHTRRQYHTAVASSTPYFSLCVTSTYYLHQSVIAGIDVVGGWRGHF